jgi:transposase InsO family protein
MVVKHMESLKAEVGLSYERLCARVGLSYSTLMRYRHRIAQGEPAVYRPGPKKIMPLDLKKLFEEIVLLGHASERSRGVAVLYARYRDWISRRDFQAAVELARAETNRQRRASLRRVLWNMAGMVWSVDEAQLIGGGKKLYLNQIQDLGSRYKFLPLVAEQITADEIASHLEILFRRYGAPMVLKRDNGPALNGQAVNSLLGRYLVVPLNSPRYYPPYNGGMERAQRELKERLLCSGPLGDRHFLQARGEAAAHDLNHHRRRSLAGRTACAVFQAGRENLKPYHRRKRKEVFDWITALAVRIVGETEVNGGSQAELAWRIAVEMWLRRTGIITVSLGKSVTRFSQKSVS